MKKANEENALLDVLFTIVAVAVAALLSSAFVMLSWNLVVPELFGLSSITFKQAFCLFILSNLLIKRNTWKEADKD